MADPAPETQGDGAPARRSGVGRLPGPELRARIGAAVAMMIGALASAWAGGYWFGAFWLIAALIVHWEWQRLIGGPQQRWRVICGSAGLVVAALLASGPRAVDGAIWAIAAVLIGAAGAVIASGPRPRLMAGAGALYAGAMLVSTCLLRAGGADGLAAIFWLFAVVWGADIMAFFGGRFVGGPKLWPRISPGKTWSGLAIGILCGAAAGLLVAPTKNAFFPLFCFGLAIGAISQGGDLFESGLKRRFGVKDSSRLIPGHGGLMDRLDGFTAAAISTAFVGAARYEIAAMAAGVFQW